LRTIRVCILRAYLYNGLKGCKIHRRKRKERKMPIIHVHMFEGRTLDQKRKLVSAMTDAVVKSLEAKPETVRILLHDMSKSDMSVAGVLHSDKKS
jgi:4-oxalocrotonate tautomerase